MQDTGNYGSNSGVFPEKSPDFHPFHRQPLATSRIQGQSDGVDNCSPTRNLLLLLLGLLMPIQALAATNLDDGTAIKGFDPVSYFDGVPRMGKRDLITTHDGAIYRFYNEQNQQRFAAEPERYVPAFGGFCAWGVLDDTDREDIQPGSWKIVDGRLLLFYKSYLGDGRRDWDAAAETRGGDKLLLKQADGIWQQMEAD